MDIGGAKKCDRHDRLCIVSHERGAGARASILRNLKLLHAAETSSFVEIVLRVLAASTLSYGVTYEATAALALVLPVDRLSAVIISTNLSFLLMTTLVLWSFCCRSLWRLLGRLLGAAAVLAIFVRLAGK